MSLINKEPYITPEMIAAWNAGGLPKISNMTPLPFSQNTRFETVLGGYTNRGGIVFIDAILKLKFSMIAYDPSTNSGEYDTYCASLPPLSGMDAVNINIEWLQDSNPVSTRKVRLTHGYATISQIAPTAGDYAALAVACLKAIDGTSQNIWCHIHGYYCTK